MFVLHCASLCTQFWVDLIYLGQKLGAGAHSNASRLYITIRFSINKEKESVSNYHVLPVIKHSHFSSSWQSIAQWIYDGSLFAYDPSSASDCVYAHIKFEYILLYKEVYMDHLMCINFIWYYYYYYKIMLHSVRIKFSRKVFCSPIVLRTWLFS